MKIIPIIVSSLLFLAAVASVRADDGGRTAFPGSLAPVPARAHDLTAARPVDVTRESVTFQIALRLSPAGTAPEAAYQSLVRWLREQGLSVNAAAFPQHTEIEASGTVEQAGKALGVRFGRVEIDGRNEVAAVSAPSLPATLAAEVIGINGLQPFLRKL